MSVQRIPLTNPSSPEGGPAGKVERALPFPAPFVVSCVVGKATGADEHVGSAMYRLIETAYVVLGLAPAR